MMSERKIREIAADGMRRLGYGNVRPGDVPAGLVRLLDHSINQSGTITLVLEDLSKRHQEMFLGAVIGLLAMDSPFAGARKNAAKQLRAAASRAAA